MCRPLGQRGQEGQALGRSRGGFTTKIHAKSDASGHIIAFDLTGGEASDARHFDILLDIGPDIQPRAVICDSWLKMSFADYDICLALPGGGVTFVEAH
jgi:hypothetical protein